MRPASPSSRCCGFGASSSGIVGLPDLEIGSFSFYDHHRLGYYLLGAVLLFSASLVVRLTTTSSLGFSLVALRTNGALSASRGINRKRQQFVVFVLGAAIAGLAGSFNAYFNSVVSIDVFGMGYLTLMLSMIFLGGRNSIPGIIVGSVVITILNQHMSSYGAWAQVVSGLAILVVLWIVPDGLAGLAATAWQRAREFADNRRAPTTDVIETADPIEVAHR